MIERNILGLILFCLNLSFCFTDYSVKIGPRKVYVSLGGCANITNDINLPDFTITNTISSGSARLYLHGADGKTQYSVSQMGLLKYVHSFDAKWVVLCGIDANAEGIKIRFILKKGTEEKYYESEGIRPDYCVKSKRCTPWYLPMNGNGNYLPEIFEFDGSKDKISISIQNLTKAIQSNGRILLFGPCSYIDCMYTKNFEVNEPLTAFKGTYFRLKDKMRFIEISRSPSTMNNHIIMFVFYRRKKLSFIRTRLIVTDEFISKPVYNLDSLVFNVINTIVTKINYEGKIYYINDIVKIEKSVSFSYPLTISIDIDQKGTYAAIWLAFEVYTITSGTKNIPIYMKVNIDLTTGIIVTEKEEYDSDTKEDIPVTTTIEVDVTEKETDPVKNIFVGNSILKRLRSHGKWITIFSVVIVLIIIIIIIWIKYKNYIFRVSMSYIYSIN